jgi:hypothetical protein
MRTAADFIGIIAYLCVMYRRLPDRALLAAVLRNSADTSTSERPSRHLSVVPPRPPAVEVPAGNEQSRRTAA